MSRKISFETVKEVGLKFPLVQVSTAYGKPALKVSGKTFACMASHNSAEADSLVIGIDFEQRAELLSHDPSVYYITEHYKDYPGVLVRLTHVTRDVLVDLLGMAYRRVAKEAAGKGKSAPPNRSKHLKKS